MARVSTGLVAAGRSGRRGIVLATAGLMLAPFLVSLDQTVVGTALPKLVADFNGFHRYSWVPAAYLLASTATIPVIGKLGDIYGRKFRSEPAPASC
jgi:MFS family permease